MNRRTFKLAIGLSVIAVCGSAASAQSTPGADAKPREAAVEVERPIELRTVNPSIRTRSSGPVVLTRKDLRTGQETQIPLGETTGTVQDAVDALLRGGNAEDFYRNVQRALGQAEDQGTMPNAGLSEFGEEIVLMDRGLSSRTLVTNTTIQPNSRNCKMTMTFDGRGFGGSAIMIDPKWCMTAGHCVHTSSDPEHGLPAGIYATNVRVYPGYNNGENPAFGSAKGIALYTLSGWRNGADWDYDVAFVELDRPIGALSGWAGFGAWNGETGLIFSGTTYSYKGYPIAGGYGGQRMYSRTGDFDVKWGNVAYTAAISYGGESGSGFVRTNGVAQAVLSHGANIASIGGATGAVAVWGDLYNTQMSRMLASTPVQADLIPMMVRTVTTSKNRGGVIPAVDIVIHNYSRSTFSGTPSIQFRFSTNEYISSSDATGIARSAGFMSIPPKSSRAVRILNVVVPANAPVGNLYLGATLNNVDANILNNATNPVDTDRLTVN